MVEKNVHRLLDLFDSVKFEQKSEIGGQRSELPEDKEYPNQPSAMNYEKCHESNVIHGQPTTDNMQNKKVCATFFILGWIAERLPHLVRDIQSRGHEVASHGNSHKLCYSCGYDELRQDLSYSKKLLEDIIGTQIYGYRAPSFSISHEILKIIEECGYVYDSSYNSFGLHGRYGNLDLSSFDKNGNAFRISDTFYELPISNLQFPFLNSKSKTKNHILPWGGGGYFRLLPFPVYKIGVDDILSKEGCYLFYMHPWEIDPQQPKINLASFFCKFKHYSNLKRTETKLFRLIQMYLDENFLTCNEYLALNGL